MASGEETQTGARRVARERLAARLRRDHGSVAVVRPPRALPTGLPDLDALLAAGGLPRGRLTAVAGTAATALLHRVLAAITRAGTAAWVDPLGRLAATALHAEGVDLPALLVARPDPGPDVLRAAAILQAGAAGATGAFDLLVVDAPDLTARQGERLATIARLGATALVLLTESHPWLPATADLVLLARHAAWRQEPARLRGRAVDVAVQRQRSGREGGTATLELDLPRSWPPIPGLERLRPTVTAAGERGHGAG